MIRKTVILEEDLVQQVNVLAKKEYRDFSSSLRHALRVGLLALQNPELTADEIQDILEAKAEMEAGLLSELDLENIRNSNFWPSDPGKESTGDNFYSHQAVLDF
jgi:hypothetical protein